MPWPQFLDIILTLLRAGAPLDSLIGDPAIARPIPRCSLPRNSSAELVMLRFEVRDTGCGVDEVKRVHVHVFHHIGIFYAF